jgi:hypothetical protein
MKTSIFLSSILMIITISLNVNAHLGDTTTNLGDESYDLTVEPKVTMNFRQCVSQLMTFFKMTADAAGAKCTEWGHLTMDTNSEARPEVTEVAL